MQTSTLLHHLYQHFKLHNKPWLTYRKKKKKKVIFLSFTITSSCRSIGLLDMSPEPIMPGIFPKSTNIILDTWSFHLPNCSISPSLHLHGWWSLSYFKCTCTIKPLIQSLSTAIPVWHIVWSFVILMRMEWHPFMLIFVKGVKVIYCSARCIFNFSCSR